LNIDNKFRSRTYRINPTLDRKFRRDLLQYDGANGSSMAEPLPNHRRRLLPLLLLYWTGYISKRILERQGAKITECENNILIKP
jgi:hypothetical protein